MLQPFSSSNWATSISNPFLKVPYKQGKANLSEDKTTSMFGDFDETELKKPILSEPKFSLEDETEPTEFKIPIVSSKDQAKDMEIDKSLQLQFESIPSSPYQSLKLKETINSIIADFDKWIDFGTNDSLVFIANIKESIKSNYSFFSSNSNSRIVANTLMLIFDNSVWSEISLGRIKSLHEELKRFSEGEFRANDVKTFMKQAYRAGLTPIKRTK